MNRAVLKLVQQGIRVARGRHAAASITTRQWQEQGEDGEQLCTHGRWQHISQQGANPHNGHEGDEAAPKAKGRDARQGVWDAVAVQVGVEGVGDVIAETLPFAGVTCPQRPAVGNEVWLVEEDGPRFLKQGRDK